MVRLFGFLSRAGDLPRKFNGNGLKTVNVMSLRLVAALEF